jgi:hypothetical protein
MLLAGFELGWPTYVFEFLSYQEAAGSMGTQAYGLQCILDENKNKFYQELLILVLGPLVLTVANFGIWLLISFYRKDYAIMIQQAFLSYVTVMFFVLPSVIKQTFAVFNCEEIEPNENWIAESLDTPCWSDEHYQYIFYC